MLLDGIKYSPIFRMSYHYLLVLSTTVPSTLLHMPPHQLGTR